MLQTFIFMHFYTFTLLTRIMPSSTLKKFYENLPQNLAVMPKNILTKYAFAGLLFFILLSACQTNAPTEISLKNISPINGDGSINALIEIPAGTIAKYELNKNTGKLEIEQIDGKDRMVQYLGYPGNYGMIPSTLLAKEDGGDGDPLDVLVLGPACEKGAIIEVKPIGVLHLMDRGEHDDKIIAVSKDSPFYQADDIKYIRKNHKGVLNIIETWFSHYKGPGKMKSKGFSGREEAMEVLNKSIIKNQ